ncbi:MAG: amidohydrolase family protein [Desulfobacterales bacterium]
MKLIDSHFHIYKSEQAGIMAQGGQSFLGFKGIFEEALPILDRGRIRKIMGLAVLPVFPMRNTAMIKWSPDLSFPEKRALGLELEEKLQKRLSSYNEWLCRTAREDGRIEPVIVADATIDRNYMAEEIQSRIDEFQIKALKIHPTVNGLSPAAEGYSNIFEIASDRNLVVISHGGLSGEDMEGKLCSPENFEKALTDFPKLKLVVAHLAFPHVDALLELSRKFPGLYTDISFVLRNTPLSDDDFCRIIRDFGPERVLFGSDAPWSDPEKDANRLLSLALSEKELERVAWKNAAELFRLE